MNKSGISIPPRHGRGGGRKGRKTVGKRRPAGKRRSALPLILAAAAVLAIALIAIFLPRYLRKKPEDALDAVFFDVGQGDAILLSFPEGEFALIDAGSRDDAELLVEELACRGVRRLSFAAVTHPHEDHAGGMEAVLRAIPADKVYLSDGENDAGYYIDLLEWLEKSGTPCGVPGNGEVVYEKAGCRVTADDGALCTRLYLSVETGEDGETVTETYEDAAARAQWGIICKTAGVRAADVPDRAAWARRYFARYGRPDVQITVDGEELNRLTGERMDEMHLGRLCRVALAESGAVYNERIVSIRYPDLLRQPERVTVCLAGKEPDAASGWAALQRRQRTADARMDRTEKSILECCMSLHRLFHPGVLTMKSSLSLMI